MPHISAIQGRGPGGDSLHMADPSIGTVAREWGVAHPRLDRFFSNE